MRFGGRDKSGKTCTMNVRGETCAMRFGGRNLRIQVAEIGESEHMTGSGRNYNVHFDV